MSFSKKDIFGNTIIRFGAILGAVTVITGSLWAAGDYTGIRPVIKNELQLIQENQKQLTENLLSLRFQILMQKKKYGGLTFYEQQELCRTAKSLDYVGIPGCSGEDTKFHSLDPVPAAPAPAQ